MNYGYFGVIDAQGSAMTLDDARARLAAMLEYADAYVEGFGENSAWTFANMDGAHVLARKAATHALNAAALCLALDGIDTLSALQSPPPREADAALWPLVEEWQTARRDLRAAERDEHGVEAAETRSQDSARALEAYRPPSAPAPGDAAMTPDTRTALDRLRAQVEARMGSHDQAAMRTGEVAYAALLGLIDALLSTNPGEPSPCIGRDPLCPCQDGDSCHYVDTKDTKAWPIPMPPIEVVIWTRPEDQ